MGNSTKGTAPRKPRKDFPLFPHQNGRWAKKVLGKFAYFGKVADDPKGEAALKKWLEDRDDLLAGRVPRSKLKEALTVGGLCNRFLEFKESQKDCGELAPRTFDRYEDSCDQLIETFGKNRPISDLAADDFQLLRAKMAKRRSTISLGPEIQMVRTAFKYAYDAGLIDRPVRFGPGFKKPTAKNMRMARIANGVQMFEPKQIHDILQVAGPNMVAMVLLGVNGALGNTDVAMLTPAAFDLKGGWLDYPRQKTGVARKIALWPETVAAVKTAIAARRAPTDPADAELLFIGARGESYVGDHRGYRVMQEFNRATAKAKVTGRTFYDLRRTFQTVAEGTRDLTAVQAIMGHAPSGGDMSAIYRQRIDDERLRAVADFVRTWLFTASKEKAVSNV